MLPLTQFETIFGFKIHRALVPPSAQEAMVDDLRSVSELAPMMRPMTAWGKPMSVRMTSAGRLGWVIDRGKYRYTDRHPETHQRWPEIPASILHIWDEVADWKALPDCCLINWYGRNARMGLHQDKDEGDFAAPVVSISLGDPALFRMGGTERKQTTRSTILNSGDVVVMAGSARLAYHGVDRVMFGEGTLLPDGGRINLTLRVVTDPI